MTYIDAVVLGIIEGLTEFLPISSTAHLILAGEVLGIPSSEFLKSFDIAIQLGAICSVVVLFARSFLDFEVLKRLVIAFVPTGVIGFLFYALVKSFLLESIPTIVFALALGGVALIVFEYFHREETEETPVSAISLKHAFGIGIFQSLGMIPGVSRSGATIIGGLLLGIPRTTIVEFSFLLAVPTMIAATGYDLFKNASTFTLENISVLAVGFVVSFVVAILAIKFLLSYVRTHTFVSFGIYRILAAAMFWLILIV
ncbi:MAG TPA: undecaprenyl-diphosphatase UppP [Candidatus Paceibacterota bacterium]